MKITLFSVFLSVFILFSCSSSSKDKPVDGPKGLPVALILDTDLGPDYDDVGAMALLHSLADSGKVTILATLSSNKDELVVPCIEAINTYFGRPNLPLGAPKSELGVSLDDGHKEKWTEAMVKKYSHQTQKTSEAPDAVKVYRQILSGQPDTSVVVCTVGFFTNLKDLLLSGADEYSPLSGKELIARKVKRLVSMAGAFPAGREFNVHCDTPSSLLVMKEWPTEILFSGYEIGEKILTGKRLAGSPVENSPIADTYRICLPQTDPNGRMSWDQTAVLVAVNGYEPYFVIERGRMQVNDDGSDTWAADPSGPQARLMEKLPYEQLASLIENYMMHQPQLNK